MRKLIATALLLSLSGLGYTYSIKHSYSGEDGSTEYYGACNDGQLLKVTQHADGRFSYEGPAGDGTVRASGSLDKAAAAACGE
ncbi:MAG: hypothetical protein OER80_10260 [Gammaproteobacteria bacterium]|nr:hypothetical protein [Gammaproteobacteria bacterium]MDH3767912.1 hypothetical protein [Gammaproteobacteria bacterium]